MSVQDDAAELLREFAASYPYDYEFGECDWCPRETGRDIGTSTGEPHGSDCLWSRARTLLAIGDAKVKITNQG